MIGLLKRIKELVKTHWTSKYERLDNIAFYMDDSTCYMDGDVALVTVNATIKMTLSENQICEEVLSKIKNKFRSRNASREDVIELNLNISRSLYEITMQ